VELGEKGDRDSGVAVARGEAFEEAMRDAEQLDAAGETGHRSGDGHRAHELGVPVTVHVAIGSDIVHQHPAADGAAIGAATFTDFRRLVSVVSDLAGGVWINLGSAVQLPEVFLKALSVAENLGHDPSGFSTANLDMVRHYRTDENVLKRPTLGKGRSFALTGHHEINVPLLAAAVGLERARRETAR